MFTYTVCTKYLLDHIIMLRKTRFYELKLLYSNMTQTTIKLSIICVMLYVFIEILISKYAP